MSVSCILMRKMANNSSVIKPGPSEVDLVRHTIVETIEAGKSRDINSFNFVEVKQMREDYKLVIAEMNKDFNITIPLTTYRIPMSKTVLKIFVMAKWVDMVNIEKTSEEQLKIILCKMPFRGPQISV